MSFEENQAIIQQFARAFNEGDLDVFDSLISRDFFNHTPVAGEQGQAEIFRQLSEDLLEALPDLQISVSDFVDEGDTCTFNATMSGNHTGGLWGAPASGNNASWTSTVVSRFADGKFAVSWPDLAVPEIIGAMRGLGIVPPPDQMDKPMPYPIVIPEILIKVVFTGQVGDKECTHLDMVKVTDSDATVCDQCVAVGDIWPALRLCLVCGFVGCCDTSKNKHMKGHYEATGHPIFRSIRLDESWVWCYEDNAMFKGAILDKYR